MPQRIITGHTGDGMSVVVQEGPPPRSHEMKHTPGMASALLWATPAEPVVPFDGTDPTLTATSFVPEPGATRLIHVIFPPGSVFTSVGFDPVAAAAEQRGIQPGLAETFEPDSPGMHTTDTVDYGVLLQGRIALELDAGRQVDLHPGDIVVQNGTRHAWRNPSSDPALMLFILIGARRVSGLGYR